jgi:hypothetical protein
MPETSNAYSSIPHIVFIVHRSPPLSFLSFLYLNNSDRSANRPSKKIACPARLRPNSPLPLRVLSASYARLVKLLGPLFFRTRRSICPGSRRVRACHALSGISCGRRSAQQCSSELCLKWTRCVNPLYARVWVLG